MLAVAACESSGELFLPANDSVSAVVIGRFSESGRDTRGFAVDVADDGPTRVPTDWPSTDLELHAFQYGCGLSILGIQPGPITFLAGGRKLPVPERRIRATVEHGVVGAWAEDVEGGETQELEIDAPATDVCFDLESPTYLELEGTPGARSDFVVPLDANRALVGAAPNLLFEVMPAVAERVSLISDARVVGAHFDRELWVIDDRGRLWSGARGAMVERARFDPAPRSTVRFASSREGPFELFGFADGTLFRFDGQSLSVVGTSTGTGITDVAWVAEGEALVVSEHFRGNVVHFQNGTPRVLALGDDSLQPVGAEWAPGMGIVVSTVEGLLFRFESDLMVQIETRHETKDSSRILVGLPRGVLYGGGFGVLSQFQPELAADSFCPDPPSINFVVGRAAMLGDRRLIALPHFGSASKLMRVAFLDLVPPADCR